MDIDTKLGIHLKEEGRKVAACSRVEFIHLRSED